MKTGDEYYGSYGLELPSIARLLNADLTTRAMYRATWRPATNITLLAALNYLQSRAFWTPIWRPGPCTVLHEDRRRILRFLRPWITFSRQLFERRSDGQGDVPCYMKTGRPWITFSRELFERRSDGQGDVPCYMKTGDEYYASLGLGLGLGSEPKP